MTDPNLATLLTGVPIVTAAAVLIAVGVFLNRMTTLTNAVSRIVDRLDGPDGLVASMRALELWRAKHEVESQTNIERLKEHLGKDAE